MNYLKIAWIHDFEDEPVLFYHEIDGDRFETRKIFIFKHGRRIHASRSDETDEIYLSPCVIPPLEEINESPDFIANEISQSEFEVAWGILKQSK